MVEQMERHKIKKTSSLSNLHAAASNPKTGGGKNSEAKGGKRLIFQGSQ